ncbi:Protein of uncharacterised function (DUF1198) [Escherichia coli]|uniref:Protein of uncharacterized function (DUF1198) n=1 Tax=Escherichia coli TaxID=562 RepID=A0A2X1JNU8_ECOLX|nr:Protein of uncharacterised function (DUF1198) [Escherichia coli]
MIWIMLATLAVVFVVGFRVLTSGARKAIRRLSDRLNIDVVTRGVDGRSNGKVSW